VIDREIEKVVPVPTEQLEAAFKLYDVLIEVNSIKNLPVRGWKVHSKSVKTIFEESTGYRVSLFGFQKSGKTWLAAKLASAELPSSQAIKTIGLGLIADRGDNDPAGKLYFLDFAGSNAASSEEHFSDKRCTESLLREISINISDKYIYITTKFLRSTQLELEALYQDASFNKQSGRLLVVHNLIECTTSDILQSRIEETGRCYSTTSESGVVDENSWFSDSLNETRFFGSKHFYHIFLVNEDTYVGENGENGVSHNTKMFKLIRLLLSTNVVHKKFNLLKDVKESATKVLPKFTHAYVADVELIVSEQDGTYSLFPRHAKINELPESMKTGLSLDDAGFRTTEYPLRPVEFVDSRAVTGRLTGTIIEEKDAYRICVEVPGLESALYKNAMWQISRTSIEDRQVLVVRVKRRPLIPLHSSYMNMETAEFSATFRENRQIDMSATEEELMDPSNCLFHEGIIRFWIKKPFTE